MPIDLSDLDSFNPLTVPTISQICSQFNPTAVDAKPRKLGNSGRGGLIFLINLFFVCVHCGTSC